jgi:peptide/nickel transport system substrate-binding protein
MHRPRAAPRLSLLPSLVGLVVLAGGCAPEPGPAPAGSTGAAKEAAPAGPYDPRTDPLVNPEMMFEPAPADASAVADGETMYRVADGNPGSLNPLFISSTYEFYLAGALYDGLFTFDKDLEWKVNEQMVESFEESPDHRVYTVVMKPGLKFHDGQPLTADDVVWSFEQVMDPRVPCPAVKTGKDQIEKVEAVDARTVRITHKQPLPVSKWNAGWTILPRHVYGKDKDKNPDLKSGDYYAQLSRAPVGNGPYRFVRWLENDRIELERWDDFHGRRPRFQRMVFRIIPDRNILLLTFNKGDVDEFRMDAKQFATQTLAGSDFARRGHKVWWPEWSYSYIGWNMSGSNPFFTDVRVRRAMTQACDVERMIRDLAWNLYQPAVGPYHPTSWMFNPEVKRLPFDLAEAGRLLDEAGWRIDEAREGWRHKEIAGQPTKFEFTLLIPQGAQISIDLAAILQQDLRSIGVDMKTQIMEWATYQERTRKHEFQASIANWGTGVDPDYTWNIWHSDQYVPDGSYGRNYVGFKNARVDELFQLGRNEFDRAKRTAYYQEIAKIIYDEQPYTFLWYRSTLWGLDKRIRGVSTGPRGIFNFDPAEFAWWVPAAEARLPAASKL